MRSILLIAAVVLLAVARCPSDAKEIPHGHGTEVAKVASRINALALRSGDTLEKIKQGLDAVQKFVDIFNSKIFEGTKVGIVAEILSKSLSFILSFLNLFGGQSESAEMQFMRKQFAEVHAKLDSISLQLDDVKNLIEWSTTRGMYAQFEIQIITASKYFDNYVKSSPAERETRKRDFVEYFGSRRFSAFKLYQAIVETDFVIASNLGAAVTYYTKNHRRQVISFLLAMSRLILRGAQLHISYERLVHSEASAAIIEADWKAWIEKLTFKMKFIEDDVKSRFQSQMVSDMNGIIVNQRHLSNQDFNSYAYRFVVDKFDWRHWMVLVFNKDTSYAVSHCGGGFFQNVAGDRHVAIASADPEYTSYTQSFGDTILARTDARNLNTNSPVAWRDEINAQIGNNYCSSAALRAVVCWGCNVWYSVRRTAYRKITSGRHIVNGFVFG